MDDNTFDEYVQHVDAVLSTAGLQVTDFDYSEALIDAWTQDTPAYDAACALVRADTCFAHLCPLLHDVVEDDEDDDLTEYVADLMEDDWQIEWALRHPRTS